MENPFSYTKIVTGPSFCNRKLEQEELLSYIKNSQNVLLYSYRRLGKTSLIHQLLSNLNKNFKYLYLDLYGTLTEKDFILSIINNLGQIESKIEKLFQITKDIFQSIKINFSLDPVTNLPTINASLDFENKNKYLEETMQTLDRLSQKNKLIIVFDEFQEIANYSKGEFEKKLRKLIQTHQNICYIFSGSRRHLLWQMFNSKRQAFYKLAESYPLQKIATKEYLKWATKLFKQKKVSLDPQIATEIIEQCENHPMHIQRCFYHLWEEKNISLETIPKIINKITDRHQDEFLSIWNSLSSNQRKTLKLIVVNNGKDLFSANSMEKVGLQSGSQVTKSLEVLIRRDLIWKNHTYHLQDVIFKNWLKKIL